MRRILLPASLLCLSLLAACGTREATAPVLDAISRADFNTRAVERFLPLYLARGHEPRRAPAAG